MLKLYLTLLFTTVHLFQEYIKVIHFKTIPKILHGYLKLLFPSKGIRVVYGFSSCLAKQLEGLSVEAACPVQQRQLVVLFAVFQNCLRFFQMALVVSQTEEGSEQGTATSVVNLQVALDQRRVHHLVAPAVWKVSNKKRRIC